MAKKIKRQGSKLNLSRHYYLFFGCGLSLHLGPVVRKPINANPRLKIKRLSLFLYSQMLFNADIRQNFSLEEVNLESQT